MLDDLLSFVPRQSREHAGPLRPESTRPFCKRSPGLSRGIREALHPALVAVTNREAVATQSKGPRRPAPPMSRATLAIPPYVASHWLRAADLSR